MRILLLLLGAAMLSGCSGKPDPNVPGPLRDLADAAGYRIVSATGYRKAGGETSASGLILERESAGAAAPERIRVVNATALQRPDGKSRIVLLRVGPYPRPLGAEPVDVILETEPGSPFRTMSVTTQGGTATSASRVSVTVNEWFKGVPRQGRIDVTGGSGTAPFSAHAAMSYEVDRKALSLSDMGAKRPGGEAASGSARFLAVTPSDLARVAYAALGGTASGLAAVLSLPISRADIGATRFRPAAAKGDPVPAFRSRFLSWLLDFEGDAPRDVSVNAVTAYYSGKAGIDIELRASPPLPVRDFPRARPGAREISVTEQVPSRPQVR